MRSVLFLGTASGVGKTTLAAAYCRYLSRKGVRVAPFKGSNLSLNSYVTRNGEEIGMGQAAQAWACGLEPSADMNPLLLKPSGSGLQAVVMGRPRTEIGRTGGRPDFSQEAYAAYDRLAAAYDIIVCEGSGSPVELNLMERDVANTGLMRARRTEAVLVADIERGGVFAAVYGTWKLMPEDVRPLMTKFIINRFRGDPAILTPGIGRIEELTGMKCVGVVPFRRVRMPEEDSVSFTGGSLDGRNPRDVMLEDLDALIDSALQAGVDLQSLRRRPGPGHRSVSDSAIYNVNVGVPWSL